MRDQGRQRPPTAAWPDDHLLAVRASEGDEQAFETLVRRHGPAVLRLADRLLGDRTEAEDAVHEAFLNAWRKLPECRGDSAFGTWLHRMVAHRCLNVLRSRRPVADLADVPGPAAPEHRGSPGRAAEPRAAVRELGRAMRTLPPEQGACWVLREVEGVPYETIADLVGISQEAARAGVFRARRRLTGETGVRR
ncbi:RNA polymerase sigma factor [Streptomyces sp. NPDC057939]|uniref:RNA polymerase sigma factor n=1 Tax=Streptomyces sp. NPDC057939 TaxID=3346284 RepID=UPI0036EB2B67